MASEKRKRDDDAAAAGTHDVDESAGGGGPSSPTPKKKAVVDDSSEAGSPETAPAAPASAPKPKISSNPFLRVSSKRTDANYSEDDEWASVAPTETTTTPAKVTTAPAAPVASSALGSRAFGDAGRGATLSFGFVGVPQAASLEEIARGVSSKTSSDPADTSLLTDKKQGGGGESITPPPEADRKTPEMTIEQTMRFTCDMKTPIFGGSFAGREGSGVGSMLAENRTVKKPAFLENTRTFGADTKGLSFAATTSNTSSFDKLLETPSKPPAGRAITEITEKKPEKITSCEVTTGEEDEITLFQTRCKLFRMEADKSWHERGTGSLKVNTKKESEGDSDPPSRLVMRTDGVLKLILNVRIIPDMPCTLKDEKYITFSSFEESPDTLTTFLVKTANPTAAKELLYHLERRRS